MHFLVIFFKSFVIFCLSFPTNFTYTSSGKWAPLKAFLGYPRYLRCGWIRHLLSTLVSICSNTFCIINIIITAFKKFVYIYILTFLWSMANEIHTYNMLKADPNLNNVASFLLNSLNDDFEIEESKLSFLFVGNRCMEADCHIFLINLVYRKICFWYTWYIKLYTLYIKFLILIYSITIFKHWITIVKLSISKFYLIYLVYQLITKVRWQICDILGGFDILPQLTSNIFFIIPWWQLNKKLLNVESPHAMDNYPTLKNSKSLFQFVSSFSSFLYLFFS